MERIIISRKRDCNASRDNENGVTLITPPLPSIEDSFPDKSITQITQLVVTHRLDRIPNSAKSLPGIRDLAAGIAR
jgi:hypothetical protein